MKIKLKVEGESHHVERASEILRRFAERARNAEIGNGGVRLISRKSQKDPALLETEILDDEQEGLKYVIRSENEISDGFYTMTIV